MSNIDVMEYILTEYMHEKNNLEEELAELSSVIKKLKAELKTKELLPDVDEFIRKNNSMLTMIDTHNASLFISDKEQNHVELYLRAKQRYMKLKKHYPLSENLMEWYNTLDEFEKKYTMYLIKTLENLQELFKGASNINKVLSKCNEYSMLNALIPKVLAKNMK